MIRVNKYLNTIPDAIITKYLELGSNPDVISLGIGEPDFSTPYHIREAAIEALSLGKTFYTPAKGLLGLRKEIAQTMSRKYQLEYDPNHEILVTIGASEAIEIALITLLNVGDEVIIVSPSYLSYEPIVKMCGGIVVNIETEEKDGFKLTKEALSAKLSDKTRLILLNYPNNPTGAIMNQDELDEIASVLRDRDLHIISDEIYSELNYTKKHASIANSDGMFEKTIVINGFSKTYAMTGWRLGYCMANKELSSIMNKIHQYVIMSAPVMSQYAGIEAIKNGYNDVLMMKEDYLKRRNFLVNRLNRMGLKTNMPHGTFYVFCNIQSTGLDSETFCEKLLQKQKVACVPGNAFGQSGEGYIRISYAYSIDHIKEAVVRLEQFLKDLDK